MNCNEINCRVLWKRNILYINNTFEDLPSEFISYILLAERTKPGINEEAQKQDKGNKTQTWNVIGWTSHMLSAKWPSHIVSKPAAETGSDSLRLFGWCEGWTVFYFLAQSVKSPARWHSYTVIFNNSFLFRHLQTESKIKFLYLTASNVSFPPTFNFKDLLPSPPLLLLTQLLLLSTATAYFYSPSKTMCAKCFLEQRTFAWPGNQEKEANWMENLKMAK